MSATERRHLPPPLIIQNPLCCLCLGEVQRNGDAWACLRCKASWPAGFNDEGTDGTWDDPDEAQCMSVGRPRGCADEGAARRCMLGESHVDSDDEDLQRHQVDGMCWGDTYWVVEITPALTVEQRAARDAKVMA